MGSSSDNSDQETYWAQEAGPKWAARQAELDALMQPVLDALLHRAALRPGEHVLDVGCGAGASTLQAAAAVGPQGYVLGADISPPLVESARARAQGQPNVEFALMDVSQAPFEQLFDRMISRFGVMFFADPVGAFRHIAQALKPGATLAFASWGEIPHNPFFTLPAQTARDVLGPIPKTDPDLPGPFAFRDTGRVEQILRDAELHDVAHEVVSLDLTPGGDCAAVAELLCAIGPASAALSYHEATEKQRAALRDALAQALEKFTWLDGLKIPAQINFFTATRN
jgi:SAM-dependent methyltransferase